MRSIMIMALIIASVAIASGEFSTGGSELLQFKGYVISTLNTVSGGGSSVGVKSAAEQTMMLDLVAHSLERVGYRVINICERVIFTVTGVSVDLN